jgi:hypothetical protein
LPAELQSSIDDSHAPDNQAIDFSTHNPTNDHDLQNEIPLNDLDHVLAPSDMKSILALHLSL